MKTWLLAFAISLIIVDCFCLFGVAIHFFPLTTVFASTIVAIAIGVRYGWLRW